MPPLAEYGKVASSNFLRKLSDRLDSASVSPSRAFTLEARLDFGHWNESWALELISSPPALSVLLVTRRDPLFASQARQNAERDGKQKRCAKAFRTRLILQKKENASAV